MKVAIGSEIFNGPWGGGNLFVINLKKYLIEKNIKVINNLVDPDIDIILLTEPRVESVTSTISISEARLYKTFINKNVKIVHRINECDERKNTSYVNKKMKKVSKYADFTVFVSSWLSDLYKREGIKTKNSKVIMSGSDIEIFNNKNKKTWDQKSKLKIVTHHWGANWNKGFDTYIYLDKLLENKEFKNKFEFNYIGNLPKNFSFLNANYFKPLNGSNLANKLKENNLYITGSINEPSGNHQIEASLCGLPVLYLDSGGIPEYQKSFGIEFQLQNLENTLEKIYNNFTFYFERNKKFNFTSNSMCEEYLKTFRFLYQQKSKKKTNFYFYFYKILFKLNVIKYLRIFISKIIFKLRKIRLSKEKSK